VAKAERYRPQFLNKTPDMNTQVFTPESSEYLVGKKIIEVKDNYITIDNGLRIYLDDAEIEHLNSLND
jgi:hypothetical protein